MLKVHNGLHHDVLLVGLHATGAFTYRADGDALGEGHADAGGDHRVAGTGQVIIGQVVHAAQVGAVNAQSALDGALVTAGLNQGGNGSLTVNNAADSAGGFLHVFRVAHQCAGNGHGHIILNAVPAALVNHKGGKIIGIAPVNHLAYDGVHVAVGTDLIVHIFILGKLGLQFIHQHGLIHQLLIFCTQVVVLRFQVSTEL